MSGRLDRKLVKQLTGKPSTEFAGVEQVIASNQGLSEVGSAASSTLCRNSAFIIFTWHKWLCFASVIIAEAKFL